MAAIRWDNINRTGGNYNAVTNAAAQGSAEINQGFANLQSLLNNQNATNVANRNNEISNNDVAFSQYMNDLQSGGVDAVEAARNNGGIANQIAGYGGMLSKANQLRDGSQILTGARTDATAGYNYDQGVLKQELDPLVAQFKQLAFTDPNAAQQFAGENAELFQRGLVDVAGIMRNQSTAAQTYGDSQTERAARDPIYRIQQAIEKGDLSGAETIYNDNKSVLDADYYNFAGALRTGKETKRTRGNQTALNNATSQDADAETVALVNQSKKDSGLFNDDGSVKPGISNDQIDAWQNTLKGSALEQIQTNRQLYDQLQKDLTNNGATAAERNAANTAFKSWETSGVGYRTQQETVATQQEISKLDAQFPQQGSMYNVPTGADGEPLSNAQNAQAAIKSMNKASVKDAVDEDTLNLFFKANETQDGIMTLQSLMSTGIADADGVVQRIPADQLQTILADVRDGANWLTFQKRFSAENINEAAKRLVNSGGFKQELSDYNSYTNQSAALRTPPSAGTAAMNAANALTGTQTPEQAQKVIDTLSGLQGSQANATATGQILTQQGAVAQIQALQTASGAGAGQSSPNGSGQTNVETSTVSPDAISAEIPTLATATSEADYDTLRAEVNAKHTDSRGRTTQKGKELLLEIRTKEQKQRLDGIKSFLTGTGSGSPTGNRGQSGSTPTTPAPTTPVVPPAPALMNSGTPLQGAPLANNPQRDDLNLESRLMNDLYSAQPQGNVQAAPQAQPAPAALAPQAQITSPLIEELYQGARTPPQLPPQNRPAAPVQAPSLTQRAQNLAANTINSGAFTAPITGAALLSNTLGKDRANVNRQKEATNQAASNVLSTVAQENRENTARTVNNLMSAAGQAKNGVAQIAQMAKKALPEMGIGLTEFDRLKKESKAKLDQSGVTSLTVTEITSLLAQGTSSAIKPYVKALRAELAKRDAEEAQSARANESFMESQLRNLVTI